jgi:hypothetical protein
MDGVKNRAATCRWAHPTLFEPNPHWLDAETRPWTCERDVEPHALETTEVCEDCPRWAARADHHARDDAEPSS